MEASSVTEIRVQRPRGGNILAEVQTSDFRQKSRFADGAVKVGNQITAKECRNFTACITHSLLTAALYSA
jgi:hypothetical protein